MKVKNCNNCPHLIHLSDNTVSNYEGLPPEYNKLCKVSEWQHMTENEAKEGVHPNCAVLGYSDLRKFATMSKWIDGDGTMSYEFKKDTLKSFIDYILLQNNNKQNCTIPTQGLKKE